jgi:4a-hydroxytetrahydrobiopterin dehydratase
MENYPQHWQKIDNKLVRVFIFNNYIECIDFVLKITPLAEAACHHPDIEIFQYRHVKISLNTHDAGGIITQKDIDLALEINNL